jgi:hypothetical protein
VAYSAPALPRLALPLVLLVSILGARPGAAAPAIDAARRAFGEGQQHYDLGEFAEALQSFKDAYRLKEDPALLFNIGQCQFKLEQDEAALHSYRSYLRRVGETPYRGLVESRIHELEARLARSTSPPPPSPPPPRAEAPPVSLVAAPVVPPPPQKPASSRWWIWPIVGAAVAGAVVAGILASRDPTKVPSSDLGARRIFQ